jgi:penicillin amidase
MSGDAERARALLAGWDGDLLPGSAAALLYAQFRQRVARALFEPIVGAETWGWLIDPANTGGTRLVTQWMFNTGASLAAATAAPDGRAWDDVLPSVLAAAWAGAAEAAGDPDPTAWRWDAVHRTNAEHTLSPVLPEHAADLNPPAIPLGGDPDTLQVSGYAWSPGGRLRVSSLSVYRQVVDFAAPDAATWVIPGGASGLPGTPHYADQIETWRAHERIPMHLAPEAARAAAQHTLTLEP